MLETIAVILIILWLLGFLTHVAGNLIHFLLLVGIVLLALRFLKKA